MTNTPTPADDQQFAAFMERYTAHARRWTSALHELGRVFQSVREDLERAYLRGLDPDRQELAYRARGAARAGGGRRGRGRSRRGGWSRGRR